MNIESAKYISFDEKNVSIKLVVSGETILVPFDSNNRHYAEILRQVDAGTLTIANAD